MVVLVLFMEFSVAIELYISPCVAYISPSQRSAHDRLVWSRGPVEKQYTSTAMQRKQAWILVLWPSRTSSSLLKKKKKKKKREKEEGPVLGMGRLFIRRLLAAHDYGCFYTFNVVCLLDFMVRHKLIFGRSVSTDGINNALMRCILRWSDRTIGQTRTLELLLRPSGVWASARRRRRHD